MNAQLVGQHIDPIARDIFVMFTCVGLGVIEVVESFCVKVHMWLNG
jgi:hypothetical protein